MRIAAASDHAGWKAKSALVERLRALGHEVTDFGAYSEESCDYPDFAQVAARAVAEGRCDQAVLVCGTGVGMSMAANKVRGIRAAACQCIEAARYARRHNDANVLCLGARINSIEELTAIVDAWLSVQFEGGRHERRVQKVNALDGCRD